MKTPLSIQLYSLRTLPTLQNILDTVKSAGYRHVELIGSHLDNAASVKQALDERGLSVSSAHVGIAALRERFDVVMQACKTLGFTQLFMPSVPPEERQSPEPYWTFLGRELGQMAWRARDKGIELGISQPQLGTARASRWPDRPAMHVRGRRKRTAEMAGRRSVAGARRSRSRAMAGALPGPDRVGACQGPRATRHQSDEDGWADVGLGVLDWRNTLAPASVAHGAQWLVAEHDMPSDPARFARNSFAFLNSL